MSGMVPHGTAVPPGTSYQRSTDPILRLFRQEIQLAAAAVVPTGPAIDDQTGNNAIQIIGVRGIQKEHDNNGLRAPFQQLTTALTAAKENILQGFMNQSDAAYLGDRRNEFPGKLAERDSMTSKERSPALVLSDAEYLPLTEKTEKSYPQSFRIFKGHEEVLQEVQTLLDQLTVDNYKKTIQKLNDQVQFIETAEVLHATVGLIFDKAVEDPNSAELCAKMCRELIRFETGSQGGESVKFRTVLLQKAQTLFDESNNLESEFDYDGAESSNSEVFERDAKRRYVGNIWFISELHKVGMLTDRVILRCLSSLLPKSEAFQGMNEERLEYLCILLQSSGQTIKHRVELRALLERLENLSELTSRRIHVMIEDTIGMINSWLPVPQTVSGSSTQSRESSRERPRSPVSVNYNIPMSVITRTHKSGTNQYPVTAVSAKEAAPLEVRALLNIRGLINKLTAQNYRNTASDILEWTSLLTMPESWSATAALILARAVEERSQLLRPYIYASCAELCRDLIDAKTEDENKNFVNFRILLVQHIQEFCDGLTCEKAAMDKIELHDDSEELRQKSAEIRQYLSRVVCFISELRKVGLFFKINDEAKGFPSDIADHSRRSGKMKSGRKLEEHQVRKTGAKHSPTGLLRRQRAVGRELLAHITPAADVDSKTGPPALSLSTLSKAWSKSLSKASISDQKQMLGEKLFPFIRKLHPRLAGKLTDMLLERDNAEIMTLLESPEELNNKVDEMVTILNRLDGAPAEIKPTLAKQGSRL